MPLLFFLPGILYNVTMLPVIIIAGPTGTGKTAIAVEVARLTGGEIISADSRQVYKYLDIGTNKEGEWDSAQQLRVASGIPQHLTDLIDPSETFNAGDFAKQASSLIAQMRASGKLPIVVGGTGLYIKALVDGLAPMPRKDPAIRAELQAQLSTLGKEHLYNTLKSIDPEAAEKNRDNPQRMIRALEVYRLTGKPITELHRNTVPSPERFIQFGLLWNNEELSLRLDERCRKMLDSGMIEETREVVRKGYPAHSPGLEGIGYRDVISYLEGKLDRNSLETLMARDTRRYVKRQMTWFKRDERIRWLSVRAATFDPRIIAGQMQNITDILDKLDKKDR